MMSPKSAQVDGCLSCWLWRRERAKHSIWRGVTCRRALEAGQRIAHWLITQNVLSEHPVAILSENNLEYALLTLTAMAWPDWLPWNHTLRVNHDFNLIQRSGGTLYIGSGWPVPRLFPHTMYNLREIGNVRNFSNFC
jgi:hypothetical protein